MSGFLHRKFGIEMLKIEQFPHPVLMQKSSSVKRVNKEFKEVVSQMWRLLKGRQHGVGLAANQVGIPLSFFLTSVKGDDRVWINPTITRKRGKISGPEGCLSFPNMSAKVLRSKHIWVEAYDLEGNHVKEKLTGFSSIVFQHEYDHILGINFLDKADESQLNKLTEPLSELEMEWGQIVLEDPNYSHDALTSRAESWVEKFG